MENNYGGRTEKELALWMLDRMRDSEEFLEVVKAARMRGRPDVLDTPDYVARHKGRLKKLYEGDTDDTVGAPSALAATIEEVTARDLLSGREELIEKALAAYLASHPKGAEGLPNNWQSTFDLAKAEIEGQTHGAFKPGFAAELATAARAELDRQAAAERGRDAGREQ